MRSRRLARSLAAATALGLGAALLVATPAHAADHEISSVEELNAVIQLANSEPGWYIEASVTADFSTGDTPIEPMTAGNVTLSGDDGDGGRYKITIDPTSGTGDAGFRLADTARLEVVALEIEVTTAGAGPAIQATGTEGDADASPSLWFSGAKIEGEPYAPAILVEHAGISAYYDGLETIGGSTGMEVTASFGAVELHAVDVRDAVGSGIAVTTTHNAWVRLFDLQISGGGEGLSLRAEDDSLIEVYGTGAIEDAPIGLRLATTGDGFVYLHRLTVTGSTEAALRVSQDGGRVVVGNSTFSENVTTGSVVSSIQSSGELLLQQMTIVGNTVPAETPTVVADRYGASTVSINGSVIADNGATRSDLRLAAGDSVNYSLIGLLDPADSTTRSAVETGTGNFSSIDDPVDPELGPLEEFGANASATMIPLPDSPLVNAGDPDYDAFPTDARGEPRISGGRIDMGAVEVQFAGDVGYLTATPGDGQVALTWEQPADTGDGDGISYYRVEYRAEGAPDWSSNGEPTTTDSTITGLTNGEIYEFRVAPYTSYGPSPFPDPIRAVAGIPIPALELSPAHARAGEDFVVTATGFPVGSWVTLSLVPTGAWLGDAGTGDIGRFEVTLTVPDGAEPGAYTLVATLDDDEIVIVPFTVDAPEPPALQLSQLSGALGDTITVTGSGFTPGDVLEVYFNSTPILLASTTVGGGGSFSLTFQIPTQVSPGSHTVTAVLGGTVLASIGISVTGSGLASTGDDPTGAVAAGLVLLLLGVAGIAVRRGRRDRAGDTSA